MKRKITTSYSPKIAEMLNETDICLCCGKKLKYLDKEKRRNRGYCSLKCFYYLPPRYAYIQKEYSIKAVDFITRELSRTDSVNVVAGLIGVNKQSLYSFIEKHRIRRITSWVVGL